MKKCVWSTMLLSVASLCPAGGDDSDWPCWRGPNGDGKTAVKGIRTDFSGGLKVLWQEKGLPQSHGACSIKGERLVVGGHVVTRPATVVDKKVTDAGAGKDTFVCLNADTGKLIWKSEYEAAHTQNNHQAGPGPHATPYIDGESVYTMGAFGQVTCWRLAGGERVWQTNVLEEGGEVPFYGFTTSPLVMGDVVIVQGGGKCQVIAFDKATGKVAWKSGEGQASYAAPTPATIHGVRQVVVLAAFDVMGLDPATGKTLWKHPYKTKSGHNHTTPVVSGDIVLVSSGYQSVDQCLAFRVGPDGKTTRLWGGKTISTVHSDGIVLGEYLYSWSGGRGFYTGGPGKCVELATGKERWSIDVNPAGGQDIATIVYVDGYLLYKTYDGRFGLLEARPEAARKVTEWRPAKAPPRDAWTVPVLARGKLYDRFRSTLTCYDLMGK